MEEVIGPQLDQEARGKAKIAAMQDFYGACFLRIMSPLQVREHSGYQAGCHRHGCLCCVSGRHAPRWCCMTCLMIRPTQPTATIMQCCAWMLGSEATPCYWHKQK